MKRKKKIDIVSIGYAILVISLIGTYIWGLTRKNLIEFIVGVTILPAVACCISIIPAQLVVEALRLLRRKWPNFFHYLSDHGRGIGPFDH